MKRKLTMVQIFPFVIGLTFILDSCEKKQETGNLITIEVDANESEEVSFETLAEDIEVINLETSPESTIGNVDKIIIEDSLILIQDELKGKGVYCFNFRGNFLFKIGTIGRGPGEFNLPEDFVIDGELISIFDNGRMKKINYNLKGEFINETSIRVRVMNVQKFSSDTLLIRPRVFSPQDIEGGYNLKITNGDVSEVYNQFLEGLRRIEDIAFILLLFKPLKQ